MKSTSSSMLMIEEGGGKKATSLVAQTVKNPPAMQETWDRSLVKTLPLMDPLESSQGTGMKSGGGHMSVWIFSRDILILSR